MVGQAVSRFTEVLKSRSCIGLIAIAIVFITISWQVSIGFLHRFKTSLQDGAGFVDLVVESGPVTDLKSPLWMAFGPFLDLTGESNICSALNQQPTEQTSVVPSHPYLIAILLRVLAVLPGVEAIIVSQVAVALSLMLCLAIPFVSLIKARVGLVIGLLFVALIVTWPVFAMGFLGQIYFDRLFMGLAAAMVIAIWWLIRGQTWIIWLILPTLALAASISERAALMTAIIAVIFPFSLIGFKVFHSKRILIVVAAGLVSGLWFLVWTVWIQSSVYYSSISLTSTLNTFLNWSGREYPAFFMVILPFLLLSLLYWRNIPLVAISLAPNLAVTVGGAELVGFATHYHSLYGGVLIGLAAIGVQEFLSKPSKEIEGSRPSGLRAVSRKIPLGIFLGAGITYLVWLGNNVSYITEPGYAIPRLFGVYDTQEIAFIEGEFLYRQQILADLQGLGANTVSAPETWATAFVGENLTYQYWPIGVGNADALIVPIRADDGLPNFFPYGVPSNFSEETERCVRETMKEKYEELSVISMSGQETLILVAKDIASEKRPLP